MVWSPCSTGISAESGSRLFPNISTGLFSCECGARPVTAMVDLVARRALRGTCPGRGARLAPDLRFVLARTGRAGGLIVRTWVMGEAERRLAGRPAAFIAFDSRGPAFAADLARM